MKTSQFVLTRFTCQMAHRPLRNLMLVSPARISCSMNRREHFTNRTTQANLGERVERRRVPIDDHQPRAVLHSGPRQVGRRRHDKRRTDHDYQISFARPPRRANKNRLRQWLSERDRRVLEPPATIRATRNLILSQEMFNKWADITPSAAIEAGG